jgi:drug/metabolite transporter (DMT)-like permease
MNAWILLLLITLMYAGYNLFVKVSGDHAAGTVTTTILATISLQTAALVVSLIFAAYLFMRGGQTFALPPASYKWAVLSGICIGIAEIGYFYLFSGTGLRQTIPASTAIPIIVCGTAVVAFVVSAIFLNEPFGWRQMLGVVLVALGVGVLFTK